VIIRLTRMTRSAMKSSAYVHLWVQSKLLDRGSLATLPIFFTKKYLLHSTSYSVLQNNKDKACPLTSHSAEIQEITITTSAIRQEKQLSSICNVNLVFVIWYCCICWWTYSDQKKMFAFQRICREVRKTRIMNQKTHLLSWHQMEVKYLNVTQYFWPNFSSSAITQSVIQGVPVPSKKAQIHGFSQPENLMKYPT